MKGDGLHCEFCSVLGSDCIVCGGRPAGVGIADPESIHFQPAQFGPRVLVRPAVPKREGCGCAWCRGPEPIDGRLLTLALCGLLAFALGVAAGIWWVVT